MGDEVVIASKIYSKGHTIYSYGWMQFSRATAGGIQFRDYVGAILAAFLASSFKCYCILMPFFTQE